MSWESIFELIAGVVGLGILSYIVIAPVKWSRPTINDREVFGPGRRAGDGDGS